MVFVYIKIYFAARDRARRVVKKLHFSKRISRRFVKPKAGASSCINDNNDVSKNGPRKNLAPKSIDSDHVTTISGAIQVTWLYEGLGVGLDLIDLTKVYSQFNKYIVFFKEREFSK